RLLRSLKAPREAAGSARPNDPGPAGAKALRARLAASSGRAPQAAILRAEDVSLHAVDLPPASERQRRAALPFALEDRLGEPLEAVHIAMCRTLPDKRVLAAVVRREIMREAVDEGPGGAIRPEQFVLPAPEAPEAGGAWAVLRDGERVLVRVSDGTGFAVSVAGLDHLWQLAGRPRVENHGAPLPDGIAHEPAGAMGDAPDPADRAVDLRQGEFAPPSNLVRPLKAVAAALVCVGLLHLALAWADLRALRGLAAETGAEAAARLAETLPEARLSDDPRLLFRQLTARAASARAESGVIGLLDRASAALLEAPEPVTVDRLVWSASPATLTLEVTAAGLESLQSAEERLRVAGLSVSAGTATAGPSGAQAALTLRPGEGG
ncbi:type II secretion system protein GspL, partial [Roseivivax sp. GX 12232]|uniref:type II secretion system protein GspL n=1 Tax=Roseivivax sp. GX 12232 TaxID=2900547 RepID=UPI001E5F0A05